VCTQQHNQSTTAALHIQHIQIAAYDITLEQLKQQVAASLDIACVPSIDALFTVQHGERFAIESIDDIARLRSGDEISVSLVASGRSISVAVPLALMHR
jgi:hypothetical protein